MQERYSWRVTYQDAQVTDEYDDARPDGRGFADARQEDVYALDLLPADNGPLQRVLIPTGASPVFFRRRYLPVEEQEVRLTIHCIGWRRDEGEAVYLFVGEDGSTLLTTEKQAV